MQRKKAPDAKCQYCGYLWIGQRTWSGFITEAPRLCPNCKMPWYKKTKKQERQELKELKHYVKLFDAFFREYECPHCGYTFRKDDYKAFDKIEPNKDTDPQKAKELRELALKALKKRR